MKAKFWTSLSLLLAYSLMLVHSIIPHHHHHSESGGDYHHQTAKPAKHQHSHSHSPASKHHHNHPHSKNSKTQNNSKFPKIDEENHEHFPHSHDFASAWMRTGNSNYSNSKSFSEAAIHSKAATFNLKVVFSEQLIVLSESPPPPENKFKTSLSRRGPPAGIS